MSAEDYGHDSSRPPSLPPLFQAQATPPHADPFMKACGEAMLGCESGLVVHNISETRLRAAIVFAPEVPLQKAMSVMMACAVGFQNALGALAPPEVAVHLSWQGGIWINGARCGGLRAAAAHQDPSRVPEWIVVGLDLPLRHSAETSPGDTPDQTYLSEEGCVEVDPVHLLEAWTRHTLQWINRLESEGTRALLADWRGLAKDIGEQVEIELSGEPLTGTFAGLDEDFGMLLRDGDDTRTIPLSACLEAGAAR